MNSATGEQYLKEKLASAIEKIGISDSKVIEPQFERPKIAKHGDISSNVAMLLAAKLKQNPPEIANRLLVEMELDSEIIQKAVVAGPGFINFTFTNGYFRNSLKTILKQKETFGCSDWGNQKSVQFEFVSANPTGPLNVVSARAAAVGDVLANLFNAVGFNTQREFYVNDAGRQIRLLGRSVSARYMEILGRSEAFPEEGYHGDYIRDIAQEIHNEYGEKFASFDQQKRWQQLSDLALEKMLESHRDVLSSYRINFDNWFRESELRERNAHLEVLKTLTDKGYVFEKDGAKWFRSTEFGDEKDRVLITSEGEPTYFLVDVAYHANKYGRKFELLYDLWGPDHHGYIDRVKAALVALGYPKGSFEVLTIQQVNLMEKGAVLKMSKRAGKIIEMEQLINEVGVDVARYFFVARRIQSPLDFDMDLAKNTSEENPVYYVQYAHARICNIIKHASENGHKIPPEANLNLLEKEEEIGLIKKLLEFPDVVSSAAKFLEPHRLPNYLQELAASFHRFYHQHRVVTENKDLTNARLILVESTRVVLANALTLLGISAPERM